jgi:hypothetical protein
MKKREVYLVSILIVGVSILSIFELNNWLAEQRREQFIRDNVTVIILINNALPGYNFVQLEEVKRTSEVPTWWKRIISNWTNQEDMYIRFFIAQKYDPKIVPVEENQTILGIVTEYGKVYHLKQNTWPA